MKAIFLIVVKTMTILLTVGLLIGHNFLPVEPYKGPCPGYHGYTSDFYCIDAKETQSDINELLALERIDKPLVIANTDLSNLDFLSQFTSIDGFLIIAENDNLTDLSGLSNLTEIAGDLRLIELPINSLAAFSQITALEELELESLPQLTGLDGLQSLTAVLRNVSIKNNANLASLMGFGNLQTIGGWLSIDNNPLLGDLGLFASITDIDFPVYLKNLDAIITLDDFVNVTTAEEFIVSGLTSLSDIQGIANINFNSRLRLERLPLIDSINQFENFTGVKTLELNALPNLRQVAFGDTLPPALLGLTLYENPMLESVELNLEGREDILALTLRYNQALTRIDVQGNHSLKAGYNQRLTAIRGVSVQAPLISVYSNNALQSIDYSTLESIDSILSIDSNQSLLTVSFISLVNIGAVGPDVDPVIRQGLELTNNVQLERLEFAALELVAKEFRVTYNDELCRSAVTGLVSQLQSSQLLFAPEIIVNDNNRGC